jgi:hypothetical protein
MRAKTLFSEGRRYLLAQPGITAPILDDHLTLWRKGKKNTIEALFRSMADHAKNRGGMVNFIGDVDVLSGVLFDFQPRKVTDQYATWRDLFDEIRQRKIKVPSKMVPNNPRNSWVIYTKSILSCAQFLSSFRTAQEFHAFVASFGVNEHSKLALPLLLKEELFGFGFALACDFLKENGYPNFIKPDRHVKDIATGVGITQSKTDYGVFKDVVAYCAKDDVVPYEFDKLLYLIGSGNFYLNGLSVPTNKWEFIRSIR